MRVLSIASQRGNVGKTSTACALALGMRERGHRVLCIDLDPQADMSRAFGIDADAENLKSAFDVLAGTAISECIVPTLLGDIVPSSIALSAADMELLSLGRERLLAQALSQVEASYDFVVVDTPPNLGVLAWNAFYACTAALVLTSPAVFRRQDFPQLAQTFSLLRRSFNPSFKVLGVAMTRVSASREDEAANMAHIVEAARESSFDVLRTTVREGSASKVACEMANATVGSVRLPRDYAELTEEVLTLFEGCGNRLPEAML